MRLDIFLDTGVTVIVPDEMDLESDDALNQIKHLARTKFIDLLNTGFDVQFEYAGEDCAEPQYEDQR